MGGIESLFLAGLGAGAPSRAAGGGEVHGEAEVNQADVVERRATAGYRGLSSCLRDFQ
ncbi:MAG TPA: hypothetical protein VKK19_02520 [Candidatus Dormibacteraeota bacterium]|nr:hypothetical protein [Candidatus Dormibacteraeota bacterium]